MFVGNIVNGLGEVVRRAVYPDGPLYVTKQTCSQCLGQEGSQQCRSFGCCFVGLPTMQDLILGNLDQGAAHSREGKNFVSRG